MYCTNCGAGITDTDLTCPYCGELNPSAAEQEYMEKLDDLLEDTKDLASTDGLQYTDEIQKRTKEAAKIFSIVAFIVVCLFLIFGLLLHFRYLLYLI